MFSLTSILAITFFHFLRCSSGSQVAVYVAQSVVLWMHARWLGRGSHQGCAVLGSVRRVQKWLTAPISALQIENIQWVLVLIQF